MSFNLDRVPAALRKHVEMPLDQFGTFLAAQLSTANDFSKALSYYEQALKHVAKIPSDLKDKESKVRGYPATLIGYKTITLNSKSTGEELGTKLELIFAEYKKDDERRNVLDSNGDPIQETIWTGWLTYNAYMDDKNVYEMALANSVADDAVRLLGDEDEVPVFVIKETGKNHSGSRTVKTAIHIEAGFAKKPERE